MPDRDGRRALEVGDRQRDPQETLDTAAARPLQFGQTRHMAPGRLGQAHGGPQVSTTESAVQPALP